MRLEKAVRKEQQEQMQELYLEAFPEEERKPFALMVEKSEGGQVELLSIESDSGSFLGMAIMVLNGGLALLDYFAIAPEGRNGGTGGKALQMLKKRYADQRFFVEIESTLEALSEEDLRVHRKHFYLRNGMCVQPLLVDFFGIDMEILSADCPIGYEEYHELYHTVFGSEVSDRVKLLKVWKTEEMEGFTKSLI